MNVIWKRLTMIPKPTHFLHSMQREHINYQNTLRYLPHPAA